MDVENSLRLAGESWSQHGRRRHCSHAALDSVQSSSHTEGAFLPYRKSRLNLTRETLPCSEDRLEFWSKHPILAIALSWKRNGDTHAARDTQLAGNLRIGAPWLFSRRQPNYCRFIKGRKAYSPKAVRNIARFHKLDSVNGNSLRHSHLCDHSGR